MSEPVPPADHPEAIWHGGYTDSQWYCVHIIALITITLGAAGSIYILVKTYKQAKMQNWKLRITQTFPACLSVADLMSVVFHGADHITQMAHGWVYQGDWCIFFGWMLVFTTLLAAFYVTTIAVYMWCVCESVCLSAPLCGLCRWHAGLRWVCVSCPHPAAHLHVHRRW